MDPLQFIAQIAWPVAVLVVAVLYRKPLLELARGGLTRLRAGPFELAWDQARSGVERRATRKSSPRLVDAERAPGKQRSLLGPEILELADRSPREAILQAHETVRVALARALTEAGAEVETNGLDPLDLVREAESRGITPAQVTDAVLGLNVLANLAEHAPSHEPSAARAREYLAMTDGALYALTVAVKSYLASREPEAA